LPLNASRAAIASALGMGYFCSVNSYVYGP
jgi:hypothetical protein